MISGRSLKQPFTYQAKKRTVFIIFFKEFLPLMVVFDKVEIGLEKLIELKSRFEFENGGAA